MTKDEAIKLHDSKFWESLDFRARAEFQLQEIRLCMPFSIFHEAVEKAIGRPVWTHEFAGPTHLLEELRGTKPLRTMQEIIDLIPEGKRILVGVDGGKGD